MPGTGANLGATPEHNSMLATGERSLADVMAAGPLPLPVALAFGRAIAAEADAFHRGGRAHGALAPAWIMVGPDGPELPQPSGASRLATPSSDRRDFGLLFQQMLTGRDTGESSPPANFDDSLESSPETVRAAALRLADRCRRAPGQTSLRRVAIELRLLEIIMNGCEPRERAGAAAEEDRDTRSAPTGPGKSRGRTCPACGSPKLYVSEHLTILEKVLALVELKTYRCYSCLRRFINVFGLLLPRPETD
jgi:hypothetical protein